MVNALDDEKQRAQEEFRTTLLSRDKTRISEQMVAYSFHNENWKWLFDEFMKISKGDDSSLRELAYVCIGHLARIHEDFCAVEAIEFLQREKGSFPGSAGVIDDAIGDIRMFHKNVGL
jgi:hypothetical protein